MNCGIPKRAPTPPGRACSGPPQGSMPPKAWDLGLGHPLVGEVPRPLLAEADTQQSSGKHRTARGARENEGALWPLNQGGTKPQAHAAGSRPKARRQAGRLWQHSHSAFPGEEASGCGGPGEAGAGSQGADPALLRPSGSPRLLVLATILSFPGLREYRVLRQAELSDFQPHQASLWPQFPTETWAEPGASASR